MLTVIIVDVVVVLDGQIPDLIGTDFLQIVFLRQPTKQADGSG